MDPNTSNNFLGYVWLDDVIDGPALVALLVIAAFGDVYLIYWPNHHLRTFQSLTLLLIAVLFILQNAPVGANGKRRPA